jgi:hypothetical protein
MGLCFVALSLAALSAFAQAPAPEAAARADAASLERSVDAFVRAITHNPAFSDRDSLVRWNTPICLSAVGLTAQETGTLSNRLAQASSAAGATLARTPCQANFIIVATSEPDRVLNAWYARDKGLFGDATPAQITQFLAGSENRPVRIWYNIDTGRKSGTRNGHFIPSNVRAESSAFVGNAVYGFSSVFAIIDTERTAHTALDALADYVTMAGLADVDLDADLAGAPSILRLFASSAETQPAGLSRWDSAFLKALYQSDQTSRTQRFEIAERVTRDLSR